MTNPDVLRAWLGLRDPGAGTGNPEGQAMLVATHHDRPEVGEAAARLDRVKPGWAEDIDAERLDLASWDLCILGQLFGGYRQGCHALGIVYTQTASWEAFLPDTDNPRTDPRAVAWREQIWARRAPRHDLRFLAPEPLDIKQRELVRDVLRIGVVTLATMAVAALAGLI